MTLQAADPYQMLVLMGCDPKEKDCDVERLESSHTASGSQEALGVGVYA